MNLFLTISIFFLTVSIITAEELYDYKILDNKDTLMITRKELPYKFTGQLGYSFERNSGAIKYPLFANDPFNAGDNLYSYDPLWGFGIGFDLVGEYRICDFLAVGMKFSPVIYRSVEYNFEEKLLDMQFNNSITNESFFLGVAPQLILQIEDIDLDFLIGLEYEVNYKSVTTFSNSFSNTSNIKVEKVIDNAPNHQLSVFSLEITKEILTATFGDNQRIIASPYITYSYNHNFFETYSTSSSNNSFRMGIAVSLGFDDINYDTLTFKGSEEFEPINPIKMENKIIATEIRGIQSEEVKEIDVKIYEPRFSEPHPVENYVLEEETIEYLNDILHIIKRNNDTVIEIKITQPDQNNDSSETTRKADAMITYLLRNGAKVNQVRKTITSDESIIKGRIEINIQNN